MISGVFIDRPRLAIVISIVITLAGLVALTQIPIAQFPDIVPPQISVTALYPGAGATVVETTIAQPIEAQVVGVDNMLYMKSTSGNDGSYTLTVTLRRRHQPRHQHRQRPEPRQSRAGEAAQGGAGPGRQRQEEVFGAAAGRGPLVGGRPLRPALPVELRDDQRHRQPEARARRRRRGAVRPPPTTACACGSTPTA